MLPMQGVPVQFLVGELDPMCHAEGPIISKTESLEIPWLSVQCLGLCNSTKWDPGSIPQALWWIKKNHYLLPWFIVFTILFIASHYTTYILIF